MAAFTPFTPTPNTVNRQPELLLTLPDPAPSLGDPIIRPRVARYAGKTMIMLHGTAGGTFALSSPVSGAVRTIDIEPGALPGIFHLLEIAPLPFGIGNALRALRPGCPTFYLGAPGLTLPEDDERLEGGATIGSVTEVFMGVMFQDSVTLAPWAWIELLRAALESSGDAAGASKWAELATLFYTGVRGLHVLDHAGQLLTNATFAIRVRDTNGNFTDPFLRTTGIHGDLESAVRLAPLERAPGVFQDSLFGAPGEQTELRWASSSPPDGQALTVHAVYETGFSSPPTQGAILLPAGTERAHLQALELANWFAPHRVNNAMQQFHENSRVEPLIDGIESFRRLVVDLIAAAAPGCGTHITSLIIKDFPLSPGPVDQNGDPIDTNLTALAQRIRLNGGSSRFLPAKWINFNENPDTIDKLIALLAILIIVDLMFVASRLGGARTSTAGYVVFFGGELLLATAIVALLDVQEELEKRAEPNRDILEPLNAIEANTAVWAFHPVSFRDNPVHLPLPFGLEQFGNKLGFWHQKLQLVKRPPDADGNEFIAYIGGIDVNPNRRDTPGHQVSGPYHDAQARVTGPAAADIFLSFEERWQYHTVVDTDHPVPQGTPGPAFASPIPASLDAQPARHIVQVGRTYYLPHPDDGESPFQFSRNGDTSIYDTMVRAIKSAREYIYIEDQYLTPNDSHPDTPVETYFDVLLEAAQHCKRLVIIVPTETDQIVGDQRRRFLFNRLRHPSAWGHRALIGTALRRPMLHDPGRMAHQGRCYLMQAIGMPGLAGLDTVVLGPAARVPDSFPYWLWVDGELMLTAGQPFPTTVDGLPCKAVDVMRGPQGSDPRWHATPRPHQKFAPVTMAQLRGIFIHAKVTMIDDIYVTIGSANINRRGFFHDGEINVFAVPEQLRAAPDNPARAMRTRLWAEQLGISAAQGPALLGDPMAAFELFRRPPLAGNRFAPFETLDLKPYLGVPVTDSVTINILSATMIGFANEFIPTLWNTLADPTSFLEENPVPGPLPT